MNSEKHISSVLQKLNYELLESNERHLHIKLKSTKFSWNLFPLMGLFSILVGLFFIYLQNLVWILFILPGIFLIAASVLPQYFFTSLKFDFKEDLGTIQRLTFPPKRTFTISEIKKVTSTVSKSFLNTDISYDIFYGSIDGITDSGKFQLLKFEMVDNEQKLKSYCNSLASYLESKMNVG